jgi:hypothetical protein
MTLKRDGPGVRVLGRDGVLRRLNSARTEVVDYVQLSARHVEEFTTWKYPVEQRDAWVGVDGRAVTNEAHLWAVPDHIIPRDPSTMVSKPKYKKILERQDPVNCRNFPCDEDGECQAEHPPCQECEPLQECVGGPTGCLVQYLCDNTLPPAIRV